MPLPQGMESTDALSLSLLLAQISFLEKDATEPTISLRGLGGVVRLTLPMTRVDRGSRPVYYLPCSDLGQVVNLSLSVA